MRSESTGSPKRSHQAASESLACGLAGSARGVAAAAKWLGTSTEGLAIGVAHAARASAEATAAASVAAGHTRASSALSRRDDCAIKQVFITAPLEGGRARSAGAVRSVRY